MGVPAMSGTRPHLISMIDIRASGVRNRMSAPSASWKPPPNATPWIAATTGTGSWRQPQTAAFLHGLKASHIETGAKRPPFPGQYYHPDAFFVGQPLGRSHQCLKHRGIERIHLVGTHQPDIGNAV